MHLASAQSGGAGEVNQYFSQCVTAAKAEDWH